MKTKFLTLITLMVIILISLYSCKDNTINPVETQDIAGIIIDDNNLPISEALVEAYETEELLNLVCSDTTNEEGVFTLLQVPMNFDKVHIMIKKVGYPHFKIKLKDLFDNKDFEKDKKIKMKRDDTCKGYISAIVKDSASGNPIPNIWVKILQDKELIAKVKTDSLGKITLGNLCAGDYRTIISTDNYKGLEEDFTLGENDSLELSYLLIKIKEQNCCGQFTITVIDDSTKSPVVNAQVKLAKVGGDYRYLTTDDNGKVVFNEVCDGKYWIRIAKDGYKVKEEDDFEFENCDTLSKTFEIQKQQEEEKCCGVFYFSAKDSSTNEALSNVEVKLTKEGWSGAKKYTSENGQITFNELCAGKYNVRIYKENYKVIEASFTHSGNCDTTNWTKYLVKAEVDTCCNNKIIIYPKDASSKTIINGAKIILWKNGVVIDTITIENNNPAKFIELCSGKYGIEIKHENYKTKEASITLTCNSVKEEILYLTKNQQDSCCNNKLIVYAKDDSSGVALKNAKVRLWKNGDMITYKLTDENGKAVFEGICAGNYTFDIILEGYKSVEKAVEFGCEQTKEFTMEMSKDLPCKTAIFKFITKDYDSLYALTNVKVVIKSGDDEIEDGYTNQEGYFVADGLTAPKNYVITFTKEGYESKTIEINLKECKSIAETIKLKKE